MRLTIPCVLLALSATLLGLDRFQHWSRTDATGPSVRSTRTAGSGLRRAWPTPGADAAQTEPLSERQRMIEQISAELVDRRGEYGAMSAQLEMRERHIELMHEELAIERMELEQLKADIEEQLDRGLQTVSDMRPLTSTSEQASHQSRSEQSIGGTTTARSQSAGHQRRVLAEVYRSMTPEGIATVVSDLMSGGHDDDAVRVLNLLEDRKAARVLSIIAIPGPEDAALLARRLQDSRIQ